MQHTTCPLDCFDSCGIVYENNLLKGDKSHPITKGYLCPHMNHWFKHPRITNARYKDKDICLEEALDILIAQIKSTQKEKVLFYKGSGNLGIMQHVAKLFFSANESVIAKGSLCDGAGAAGVEIGRGANLPLSPLHVKKSDVVVLWGRNPSATNSHMLKALKDKKLIVIDPVRTALAKRADIFIQIKPRGDIYLSLLLARLIYLEKLEDRDFIEKRCEGYEEFIELISSIPIVTLIEKSGIDDLDSLNQIIEMICHKKVCFLVGVGVQNYSFGHQVLQAIDSLAALLGLFGKEGSGVGYLGDSGVGFQSPFAKKSKEDSLVNVDFSKYELVFVQGGNPAVQMPNALHVRENLSKTKFLVYFGLHENLTSKMADLVIPAVSFLAKEDLKTSYGHEFVGFMPKLLDEKYGISEYELTCKLMDSFGYEKPKTQKEYIESYLGNNVLKKGNFILNRQIDGIPYENGFLTKSGKFYFLDEIDDDFEDGEGFYLIGAKNKKSLNSQFHTDNFLHVPIGLKLKDKEKILLSYNGKSVEYEVINDERLREDTFLLYSGAKNANALTPPKESFEGNCAIFGELKVQWTKVE